ncbi:MAG TPA: dihydrofolate reductase family protein [Gemmatimonadaceae bacterium]|jgi:dihydrofolate reductase|nr:dihydrofolate reductase family protein [Gemmatimonadaceae bacterium]
MRRVRYRVAASLDGYIAGPDGEIDWIVPDPTLDFAALYAGFDTVLLGRRTYELTLQPGAPAWPAGWRVYVFSRTLEATAHPAVRVVSTDASAVVRALRAEPGRDIWLFGGGSLCASLLAANLVDQVEVAIMPVLLGGGIPLVAPGAPRSRLTLRRSDAHPAGIVSLHYDVQPLAR